MLRSAEKVGIRTDQSAPHSFPSDSEADIGSISGTECRMPPYVVSPASSVLLSDTEGRESHSEEECDVASTVGKCH